MTKLLLGISLIGLFLIPNVIADDGSGCTYQKPDGYPNDYSINYEFGIYCYQQHIYQQNQILIQEQHTANNISADQHCNTYGDGYKITNASQIQKGHGGDLLFPTSGGVMIPITHKECMNNYLESMK